MKPHLIIRPEAEADIFSAFDWYQEQQLGLGNQFAQELVSSIDRIINSPRLYSELHIGIRRVLLHKFPYGIYYLLKEDQIIVLAVLHLSMNPDKWKMRT